MLPLLAIQILLIAVSGGVAKPYCSWQEEAQMCLETADTASPRETNGACADETYTQLILELKYCLTKQEPTFTGCKADTNTTRCRPLGYLSEEPLTPGHSKPRPGSTSFLCLPSNRTGVYKQGPDQDEDPYHRTALLKLLTAVNICEGRGEDVATSTKDSVQLSISAPCTCLGSNRTGSFGSFGPFNASDAQLCSELDVLPEAQLQCEACNNDWDTWVNEYMGKGDCRWTAWAAAPIQGFCRAARTREACVKVNFDCGQQCGGVKSAGPVAASASPEDPDKAQGSASTEMSGAQPSAAFPAAAAAAAATVLFAARGL